MTNFTPGPWRMTDDFINVWSSTENPFIIASLDSEGSPETNAETATANAHLIAAAPDMFAALMNLVRRDLIKDTDNDHYDEVLAALRKAAPPPPLPEGVTMISGDFDPADLEAAIKNVVED